jgi:Arginyl tRNA synthetase N terminal domain
MCSSFLIRSSDHDDSRSRGILIGSLSLQSWDHHRDDSDMPMRPRVTLPRSAQYCVHRIIYFSLDFSHFLAILSPMQSLSSIISSHISILYGDISLSPTLSAPPRAEHGEYCFGVFTLAKPLGKAPAIIAGEIASSLRADTEHFTQVNVI